MIAEDKKIKVNVSKKRSKEEREESNGIKEAKKPKLQEIPAAPIPHQQVCIDVCIICIYMYLLSINK